MKSISLILLAAGNSSRFGLPVKKQWLYQNDEPLWLSVTRRLKEAYAFAEVIVVGNASELPLMRCFCDALFVQGGKSRQESLQNALEKATGDFVLINDIARCCVDDKLVARLIERAKEGSCVVPAIGVSDTVYYEGKPIEREKLLRIQTPQLSCTKTLQSILQSEGDFTDESSAFYAAGREVIFVEGSQSAHKLTYKEDLKLLRCLQPPLDCAKSGFGVDIHAFEEGKPMVLAGITIESPLGFKAHSDGDVAIHALIDALLGASSLGDIGEHFPDTQKEYKGADSKELLKRVATLVKSVGYEIVHCDITIVAQIPKVAPHKEKMKRVVAKILGIGLHSVSIKATTAEKLGFIGRKEGVGVYATATLNYYRWDRI